MYGTMLHTVHTYTVCSMDIMGSMEPCSIQYTSILYVAWTLWDLWMQYTVHTYTVCSVDITLHKSMSIWRAKQAHLVLWIAMYMLDNVHVQILHRWGQRSLLYGLARGYFPKLLHSIVETLTIMDLLKGTDYRCYDWHRHFPSSGWGQRRECHAAMALSLGEQKERCSCTAVCIGL